MGNDMCQEANNAKAAHDIAHAPDPYAPHVQEKIREQCGADARQADRERNNRMREREKKIVVGAQSSKRNQNVVIRSNDNTIIKGSNMATDGAFSCFAL